jgi:6-pyruvoyltetrahydropterin/6-carboxytetrahydropterin synthase
MKLFIDGWKSHICFSSAHILPGCGKCSHLHGHTYALHIEITGEIDKKGMLMDFTEIKKNLRDIADELDHHVLLPESYITKQNSEEVVVVTEGKKYQFPLEDCKILPIRSSTAEHLSYYILERICNILDFPGHISGVSVGVDEGMGQGAWAHRTVK